MSALVFGILWIAPARAASAELGGLRLSAEPRRPAILVGEPLVLRLSFENISSSPLRLNGPLEQRGYSDYIRITIQHESGFTSVHTSSRVVDYFDKKAALTLQPREQVEVVYVAGASYAFDDRPLHDLWDGGIPGNAWCWDFPQPGRYDVKVRYKPTFAEFRSSVWQGQLEVSSITVHVLPPQDSADIKGLEVWRRAKPILAMWKDLSGSNHELPAALSPFWSGELTSSRYAPYARYLAGLASLPDWKQAREHLIFLKVNHPEFVLMDEVLFDLVSIEENSGDAQRAALAGQEAQAKNPNSIRWRRYEGVSRDRAPQGD